jgi:hypothetical protein
MTSRQARRAIQKLDGRERRWSYIGAGVAVALGAAIYEAERRPSFHLTKGQLRPQTMLLLMVLEGLALGLTTYLGRRSMVGFVSLFVFLTAANAGFVVGAPFLILAVWLLYRSFKVQKQYTEDVKAKRIDAPLPDRPAREAAGARSPAGTKGPKGKKGPAGPEPNKRYTPKAPARPAPPPPKQTWLERRAARSGE